MHNNYYKILGIAFNATDEEIKKAYRINAIKYHPDKNPGNSDCTQKFIEIKKAYDILIDFTSRRSFDIEYQAYLSQREKVNKRYREAEKGDAHKQKYQEEEFKYEQFKSPYSSSERDNQETPQADPLVTPWGEEINGKYIFFSLPKKIGILIGGWSTLLVNTKKRGAFKLLVSVIASSYLIIAFWTLVGYSIWYHWHFNLHDENATQSLSITFSIFIGLIIFYKYLARSNEVFFIHSNYFVGVKGFAIYRCKYSIQNVTQIIELNFNSVTDYITEMWIDSSGNELICRFGKLSLNRKGLPDMDLDSSHSIFIEAEKAWTIYLLDKMESMLGKNGFLDFKLCQYDPFVCASYLRLGIGFITFLLNGKETTYKFNEIKRIYTKGTDLFIEHNNFKKNIFVGESGDKNFIPLLNLCNRQFFMKAIEILLGYSIS